MLAANSLLHNRVAVNGLPVNLSDGPYGPHLISRLEKNIQRRSQKNSSQIKKLCLVLNFRVPWIVRIRYESGV